MQELEPNRTTPIDQAEPLPFPFNQRTFCRYEPIEKRIEQARVLIVDDLLRDRRDLSATAYQEWGRRTDSNLRRERKIAELALANIRNNVERLVQRPDIQIAHLSEVEAATTKFQPDAIVAVEVAACEMAVIAKRLGITRATIVNVITDYEAEPIWVKPEVAAFTVADENVRADRGRGVETVRRVDVA